MNMRTEARRRAVHGLHVVGAHHKGWVTVRHRCRDLVGRGHGRIDPLQQADHADFGVIGLHDDKMRFVTGLAAGQSNA